MFYMVIVIKRNVLSRYYSQKTHLKHKDVERMKDGWKKIYHTKKIKDHFKMTKNLIHKEDIVILNLYANHNRLN